MDWKANSFRNDMPFKYLFDYTLQYINKDDVILLMTASAAVASYCVVLEICSDPVWCPYLLVPRAALTLKAFLLLQPWSGTFTMDITQV